MGEKHSELLSHYRGIAKVAEMVFGEDKKSKPSMEGRKDLAAGYASAEEAAAAINRALIGG